MFLLKHIQSNLNQRNKQYSNIWQTYSGTCIMLSRCKNTEIQHRKTAVVTAVAVHCILAMWGANVT